ncbi:MAG TPA: GNAT family N-acetyltransferase [Thermoanaerobaculia bacterium]|jgi:RimJ/RimL family protein N-acetyltransferase
MISIRPYRTGDGAAFHRAAMESLPEVGPWMPWCTSGFTIEAAHSWAARQVESWAERREFEFILVNEADEFLGACGLNQIDALNRRANLGYWVRTSAVRRGIATAGVRLVERWAFANTDLARLELVIAVDNAASIRVAEKAGAVREGLLHHRLFLQGRSHDAWMFSLLRSRFAR